MRLKRFIARQSRQPSGWFGKLVMGKMLNRSNMMLEDLVFGQLQLTPEEKVLEIGFGNGRLIRKIASQKPGLYVCGIDISRPMVEAAKRKNRFFITEGRVEVNEAGIDNIPYTDYFFDKVITINTIYFWPQPEQNLEEVKRVLKPNGTLFIGFRDREQMEDLGSVRANKDVFRHLYAPGEIKQMLLDAGFSSVSLHTRNGKQIDDHMAVAVK